MKTTSTSRQYFLTLNLTYLMQAFAVVAFGSVVAFLIIRNSQPPVGDTRSWIWMISVVLISGVVTAYFMFRFLIGKIKSSMRLQEKMPRYARAVLVRSSLLQVPGLGAGIAAFVTNNLHFLALSLLVFLVFVFLRPTKNTIANDLKLTPKERAMLDNDDAVISEVVN